MRDEFAPKPSGEMARRYLEAKGSSMPQTDELANELERLRTDWGGVHVDPDSPGILRADLDPTTGLMVGMRAAVIAEIINTALRSDRDPAEVENERLRRALTDIANHSKSPGMEEVVIDILQRMARIALQEKRS